MKYKNLGLITRQNKRMMFMFPVLAIPFITLIFWSMGGGQTDVDKYSQSGLNLHLPSGKQSNDKDITKLSFYNRAERDSSKMAEWKRLDPYLRANEGTSKLQFQGMGALDEYQSRNSNAINSGAFKTSEPEMDVERRIDALSSILQSKSEPHRDLKYEDMQMNSSRSESEVRRVEESLARMKQQRSEDPEIAQLSSVMDKLLSLQTPERIPKMEPEAKIDSIKTFSMSKIPMFSDQSLNFYSIEDSADLENGNAIQAVIPEDQMVTTNSTVKIQLTEDAFIEGIRLTKGTLIFGIVRVANGRLEIRVFSVKIGNSIYPVKLAVYDSDGLPGIRMPNSLVNEAIQESAGNGLQRLGLGTISGSVKAQVASAGIDAAKNFLNRKSKQSKMRLTHGYRIWLLDEFNQ